jgi:hypothetical protein
MRKLLLALALLAASTGVARAGPAPRAHDGLFLQLDLGGGAFSTEASDIDTEMSGGAGQFSFALGGAVRENFIIAGQLWLTTASDPDVKTPIGDGTLDGSVNLVGIGPNITYYFMPVNIYVSATPSFTRLTVDGPGDGDGSTEGGFGLRLAVGKEWFLGDNFGLGLNAQAAFASNDDKDDGTGSPPTWSSKWFGLALSLTFN